MVAKYGGLPLAIVTLVGLQRAEEALDDWEVVDKAFGANMLAHCRLDEIIALSYLSLPSHLKPCLLYLGIFPENTEISGTLLTQLWIAESLVTEDQLEKNYAGIAKKYCLHDLLRDFCIAKAKHQRFLDVACHMDQSTLDAKLSSLKARRAAFHSRISLPTQNTHLRSLVRFGKSDPYILGDTDYYERVNMSMIPVYKNFTLLRVLNFWGVETSCGKLSNEIGNLIHLRYLGIKATNITVFPEAVGNLRNLLTLDFRWNIGEGKFGFPFSNMTRIRHLYLGWGDMTSKENLGLDKLKELQILKSINARNWMIKEREGLSRGIKKLQIWEICSNEQLEAVYKCPSIMFDSLQTLHLRCLEDENLKLDLRKLENCQRLQKLTLYGRIKIDDSIAMPLRFPFNIVHLELWRSHLQGQDWIIALGQLCSFLCLGTESFEGVQLIVRAGAFLQLELLMLHGLLSLEEWRIEEGALTQIEGFGNFVLS